MLKPAATYVNTAAVSALHWSTNSLPSTIPKSPSWTNALLEALNSTRQSYYLE